MKYLLILLLLTTSIAWADDLTLPNGTTYQSVTITKENDAYVKVLHASGISRVKISDLSPEDQKKFGFNETAAKELLENEGKLKAEKEKQKNQAYQENELKTRGLWVVGSVNQVIDQGILGKFIFMTVRKIVTGEIPPEGEQVRIDDELWVVTDHWETYARIDDINTTNLFDGAKWAGLAWPDGNYQYNNTAGAVRTIPQYTGSFSRAKEIANLTDNQDLKRTANSSPSSPSSQKSLPKATGSGAFVSADGIIATAAHVVEDAKAIEVLTSTGTKEAKVIKIDTVNDIALLKVEGENYPFLPTTSSRGIPLGRTVFTIGFPNTGIQGFSPKLTKGEISSLNGIQDDPRHWQISVPIQPGNSGGALIDEDGNWIGIVVAKLNEVKVAKMTGNLTQNVNYALKSDYSRPLLEDKGIEFIKHAENPAPPNWKILSTRSNLPLFWSWFINPASREWIVLSKDSSGTNRKRSASPTFGIRTWRLWHETIPPLESPGNNPAGIVALQFIPPIRECPSQQRS